jgi:hypothetical protein
MNIPLPPAAFPIGNKATATATFVVAILIGLALYMAAKNKPAQSLNS